MKDKEKIYDEKISPLMGKIIAICKEEEIPFFSTFQYSEEDFCTSLNRQPEDSHPIFWWYDILKQCAEESGVNVDKFMFTILKGARGKQHTSLILQQLGVPCIPEEET